MTGSGQLGSCFWESVKTQKPKNAHKYRGSGGLKHYQLCMLEAKREAVPKVGVPGRVLDSSPASGYSAPVRECMALLPLQPISTPAALGRVGPAGRVPVPASLRPRPSPGGGLSTGLHRS